MRDCPDKHREHQQATPFDVGRILAELGEEWSQVGQAAVVDAGDSLGDRWAGGV
jgi:hypothetical protein